jgi:Flp pilus assembly protein TadD
MIKKNIACIYKFTLKLIVITAAVFLLGCTGGKGFHLEIDSGNSTKRGIRGLSDDQIPVQPDDKLNAKELPDPTSDEYETLGDALLRKGNLHLAYLQYEKSLQLKPDNNRVEYKKGLTLLIGNKNDDAITQFKKVLQKDSGYALADEGLGRAFFQKKEYAEAEKHFRKALKGNSRLWKSHNFLGTLYDYQRRYESAVLEYQSGLMIKPDNGLLHNNLGVSYTLAGKFEKAISAFNRAIDVKYTKSKVYNNLGVALANLERYSEALVAFKKGGSESRAYNNLGCIYLRQGKFEEAIQYFEKAIETEPGFYARASENLKKARAGNGEL